LKISILVQLVVNHRLIDMFTKWNLQ